MKSKYIGQTVFSDSTTDGATDFARPRHKLEVWLKDNPERDVLNISDYCNEYGERFIAVYFDKRK